MRGDADAHDLPDEQHDASMHSPERGVLSHAPNGPNSHNDSSPNGGSMSVPPQAGSAPTPKAGLETHGNAQIADASASVASASVSTSVDPVNSARGPDSQAPSETAPAALSRPLQAMDSLASTVPDTNGPIPGNASFASTVIDEDAANHNGSGEAEPTQPADDSSQFEHMSPSTITAVSPAYTGSTTYYDPSTSQNPSQTAGKSRVASANRLSVSYAAGTRRMVIDAEIVDKLKVIRADGRIEVSLNVTKDEVSGYKGILVRVYSILFEPALTDWSLLADGSILRDHRVLPPARDVRERRDGSDRACILQDLPACQNNPDRASGQRASAIRASLGQVGRCPGVAQEHVRPHVLGRRRRRRRLGEKDRGCRS